MSIGEAIGGVALGTGTALSKLAEIVTTPIEMICDWAKEPPKKYESERIENAKERAFQREVEMVRVIADIEQLKKEKDFERMKKISAAMMDYQKRLTCVNVEAVESIGSMRIELQRKAYETIHEITWKYSQIQNRAFQDALAKMDIVDSHPTLSEESKARLRMRADETLEGIIRNATNFIDQINNAIQAISNDLNLITSNGQVFIQRHLEQFQLTGLSGEALALLGHDDPDAC